MHGEISESPFASSMNILGEEIDSPTLAANERGWGEAPQDLFTLDLKMI